MVRKKSVDIKIDNIEIQKDPDRIMWRSCTSKELYE